MFRLRYRDKYVTHSVDSTEMRRSQGKKEKSRIWQCAPGNWCENCHYLSEDKTTDFLRRACVIISFLFKNSPAVGAFTFSRGYCYMPFAFTFSLQLCILKFKCFWPLKVITDLLLIKIFTLYYISFIEKYFLFDNVSLQILNLASYRPES